MTKMGPQQQRLMDRLFGDPTRSVRNFKLTPGDKPATAEELCAEINKAMDEVERRRAAGEPDDGPVRTGKEPVNVRDLVAEISAERSLPTADDDLPQAGDKIRYHGHTRPLSQVEADRIRELVLKLKLNEPGRMRRPGSGRGQ
jgi:hypothetical protein